MKTSAFLTLAAIGKLAAAHATFQEMLVNGVSQGAKGVRGTSNANNPILSTASGLSSDMMICNGGVSLDTQVEVKAGDKLTMQWHHNNPSSGPSDADEPIAASHKGPILVYIAKASTEGKGNAWVKIQEAGLKGGKWAVDDFIAAGGVVDVTIPDLEAGDYLIRPEIIALHEGMTPGATQLYNGCGQITITSSGTKSIGANAADITKVYKTDDAGIYYNIYVGKTEYTIPGPAVNAGFSGSSGSSPAPASSSTAAAPAKPTTSAAAPAKPTTAAAAPAKPTTTAAAPAQPTTLSTVRTTIKTTATTTAGAAPSSGAGAAVARWGQCGGQGYTGSTTCVSGSTCKVQNPYYSQCL